MQKTFNNRLTQLVILAIIILLALLLLRQLYVFMPGFLGAITLYILFRERFFKQTWHKKRSKALIALLYIFISIIVIAVPLWLIIDVIGNKLSAIISSPDELVTDAKIVGQKIKELVNVNILSEQNLAKLQQWLTAFVPKLINSSFSILSNFALMFFLLYFMLINGLEMERFINKSMPFRRENVNLLSSQTKSMIKANAVGIPVLAIIQGIIAVIGYWIFGVKDFLLWGVITGACSLIPIVGTAIIWLPLCLYMFAIGKTGNAVGLVLYSALLITNIDYIVRLTLLKKFMNIHPLITVFGVIIGVGLFGFWGVIFGPLLITYFIILVKIYINEYGTKENLLNE